MLHITRSILTAMVTLALLIHTGCHSNKAEPAKTRPAATGPTKSTAAAAKEGTREPLPESIGAATMKEDGTIVLQLRATGAGGLRGDALFTYQKGHHRYDKILQRVGGLKPGQSKPVPPWPDK